MAHMKLKQIYSLQVDLLHKHLFYANSQDVTLYFLHRKTTYCLEVNLRKYLNLHPSNRFGR